MPLFFCTMLCKSLLSSVLQPLTCVVSIAVWQSFAVLTPATFASSSCSVVMLLNIATDRWGRNRFTEGKGHQTLPLLVPEACTVSHMVILWLHPYRPANQDGSCFGTNMSFCIIGSCSLLSLSPVLPTPGFIMLASILGHIQVLCGSCAGAYSIGRSAAFRQRALLHLQVLCVIPSRRSLLHTSLLVQVSHSFIPEICWVNFSIGTWIPRICTDFEGISGGILAQQEGCHPFHLFTELFNITNIGAYSQALEVQQELPAPTDGDGGQPNTYVAVFQFF